MTNKTKQQKLLDAIEDGRIKTKQELYNYAQSINMTKAEVNEFIYRMVKIFRDFGGNIQDITVLIKNIFEQMLRKYREGVRDARKKINQDMDKQPMIKPTTDVTSRAMYITGEVEAILEDHGYEIKSTVSEPNSRSGGRVVITITDKDSKEIGFTNRESKLAVCKQFSEHDIAYLIKNNSTILINIT